MAKTLVINNADYSETKFATVTFVNIIPCTGIELDQTAKSVTSMAPFNLIATFTPSDTTDQRVWSSSNTAVATVSGGVVTPIGLGSATIIVTCGGFSASCELTIDHITPEYKAICGYAPFRRTTSGNALTLDKKASQNSQSFIIAADKESELYQIESKTGIDTSPYRFVPIIIPHGATKITISSTNADLGRLKTRTYYIDSSRQQNTFDTGIGAYCVYGTTGDFDQSMTQDSPIELTIPNNTGEFDSCCLCVIFQNLGVCNQDYSDSISIVFS